MRVRQRADQCERDGAASLADGGADRLAAVLDGREHRLGERQEGAAGFGELCTTAHAFDQRRAQVLLDEPDAAADRRLRTIEPAGGAGEATELGDRHEGADLVDVHAILPAAISKTDDRHLYYALDKSMPGRDP